MQPREPYYAFVHQQLRDVALAAPAQIWQVMTGPGAGAYLASRWLAVGGPMEEAQYLAVVGQYRIASFSVVLLAMPPPLFPTEAHHVALARDAFGHLRYFVMEKAATRPMDPPRAFASEWRAGGVRLRYGDLAALTPQAFLAVLTDELMPSGEPSYASVPPPPLGLAASIYPTAHTAPPAMLRAGAGKWAAIGIGAALSVFAGGWYAWRRSEVLQHAEEQQKRAAEVREAEAAFAPIRERAEARVRELEAAFARCKKREDDAARGTLERARARGTLTSPQRKPKNKALLEGARAYLPTTDSLHLATEKLPKSAWIAQRKTDCPPLPAALAKLDRELARPLPSYDDDYVAGLTAKGHKLEDLSKALERVKIEAPVAKSLVVVHHDCEAGVMASFTSTVSGRRLDLESYNCRAALVWLSIPDADVLAAVQARASAIPKRDPGDTTTDLALESLNDETHRASLEAAVDALQKQLSRLTPEP